MLCPQYAEYSYCKLLDLSRLAALSWHVRTPLREEIARADEAAPFHS